MGLDPVILTRIQSEKRITKRLIFTLFGYFKNVTSDEHHKHISKSNEQKSCMWSDIVSSSSFKNSLWPETCM